jgi:acetylornithine deacetylase
MVQDMPSGQAAERSLAWIKRLIDIDTTSRNSNLALIEEVESYFRSLGLPMRRTSDDSGAKANLFASIPDSRGDIQGGLVLSGHTDVVPVDGQRWSSDPFNAEQRGDKLYGRGACDMKGFIGTALALAPDFASMQLRKPIHFALSYDEELGCLGAPRMIEDVVSSGIRPDSCIVGEPTGMKPVVAHKGLRSYRCRVHGRAAHSSRTTDGVNAIDYAAKLIVFLRGLIDEARRDPLDDPYFDIPFTTASVGRIEGGVATNIVPDSCEFHFECRPVPGYDMQRFEQRLNDYIAKVLLVDMHAEHPDSGIDLELCYTIPSLSESERAALISLAQALTRDQQPHKVAYATEAGQFRSAGIDTIVCGPGYIAHAHRPDEYVDLSQIAACERFLTGMGASLVD